MDYSLTFPQSPGNAFHSPHSWALSIPWMLVLADRKASLTSAPYADFNPHMPAFPLQNQTWKAWQKMWRHGWREPIFWLSARTSDVDTAQANITLSQAVLNQAENQKGAGTGTGIEITRARVQLANDQQRLLVAENARRGPICSFCAPWIFRSASSSTSQTNWAIFRWMPSHSRRQGAGDCGKARPQSPTGAGEQHASVGERYETGASALPFIFWRLWNYRIGF